MKKHLALITISCMFLSLLASCSMFEEKVIPAAKAKASEVVVAAIVKEGQCASSASIKADVDKLFKIESQESESLVVSAIVEAQEAPATQSFSGAPIVSGICKSAVSLALPALLKKGVPEKWGCSLTDLSSKLEGIALGACSKI